MPQYRKQIGAISLPFAAIIPPPPSPRTRPSFSLRCTSFSRRESNLFNRSLRPEQCFVEKPRPPLPIRLHSNYLQLVPLCNKARLLSHFKTYYFRPMWFRNSNPQHTFRNRFTRYVKNYLLGAVLKVYFHLRFCFTNTEEDISHIGRELLSHSF